MQLFRKRGGAAAAWVVSLVIAGCGGSTRQDEQPCGTGISPTVLPSTNRLNAVWGSGAGDVWAVGALGTILRWDGCAWSQVASGTSSDLRAVWGGGRNDVWAVGALGTILRWDGRAWSNVATGIADPSSLDLYGLWGSGPDDVWAVGKTTTTATGAILHWDGREWHRTEAVRMLLAVWGSAPNDVWASGSNGIIMRWDGRAWSDVSPGIADPPEYSVFLWSLSGRGPDDVWVVGEVWRNESMNFGTFGRILHWDGSSWSQPWPDPNPSGAAPFHGVWATANDVWAVDSGGYIHHWDGNWSVVGDAIGGGNVAVWASSPSDVWVACRDGIRHWDGSNDSLWRHP